MWDDVEHKAERVQEYEKNLKKIIKCWLERLRRSFVITCFTRGEPMQNGVLILI